MRFVSSMVIVLPLLLIGCSKESGTAARSSEAPPAGAPLADDPAIRAIQEFIASSQIDKSKESWRYLLPKPPAVEFTEGKNYVLHMKTNRGPVTIRLRPDLAPMHVANAIYLTLLDFYDDNPSHRAMKNFMVQGGSADRRGGRGPGYALRLEADERHQYDRPGLLAAARTNDPHSAGSQFFLMFAANAGLCGNYTIYGELLDEKRTESMLTLRAMEKVSNPGDGPPLEPIVFEDFSITVE